MLEEQTIADDQISVERNGVLHIREATRLIRDGEPDPTFPAKYHRYVLAPGDDTAGKTARIVAVAAAVWTPEVIVAYQEFVAFMKREAQIREAGSV